MMDTTRTRLSFTGEWVAAGALLLGTILVGLLVVRELRVAPRAFASPVADAPGSPSAVPANAVSVPTLMLGPSLEIKVGDALADATARLGSTASVVSKSVERGPLGRREILGYGLAGTQFILVAEPFERNGAPRIAAIYLQ